MIILWGMIQTYAVIVGVSITFAIGVTGADMNARTAAEARAERAREVERAKAGAEMDRALAERAARLRAQAKR